MDSKSTVVKQHVPSIQAWENVRVLLHRLFMDEGRMLKQVMDIMKKTYRFKATCANMYKKRFRSWGFRKYSRAEERQVLLDLAAGEAVDAGLIDGQSIPAVSTGALRRFAKQRGQELMSRKEMRSSLSSVACSRGHFEIAAVAPGRPLDGAAARTSVEFVLWSTESYIDGCFDSNIWYTEVGRGQVTSSKQLSVGRPLLRNTILPALNFLERGDYHRTTVLLGSLEMKTRSMLEAHAPELIADIFWTFRFRDERSAPYMKLIFQPLECVFGRVA